MSAAFLSAICYHASIWAYSNITDITNSGSSECCFDFWKKEKQKLYV
jgi:hypothetical protein